MRTLCEGQWLKSLTLGKLGTDVLAAVLDEKKNGLAERLKGLFFGLALSVPLGKFRGKGNDPFSLLMEAGGE